MNPAPAPPSATKQWRIRLIVLIAVLVVTVLSSVFIVFHATSKPSAPKLTSPAIAAEDYLDAALNQRDDNAASSYACANQSGLQPLHSYRDHAVDLAEAASTSTSYKWDLSPIDEDADRATMNADILLKFSKNGVVIASSPTRWQLTLMKTSDWRVCSATQMAPSSSPSLGP